MPETFQPSSFGWHLQRGYEIEPRWAVVEDERELGNVKSVAVADKELRQIRGLTYHTGTRDAYEYAYSFFRLQKGPAGRFYFDWPEKVPSPHGSPPLTAVVSGSQGSRTVFVRYAWKNAQGVTRASPAESLLIPANSLLVVTLPSYPAGVTQAVIYATQGSAGTEQEQIVLTNLQTWTQPNAELLLATASPPTVNGATERPLCKLTGGFRITRLNGLTYQMSFDLEETYTP